MLHKWLYSKTGWLLLLGAALAGIVATHWLPGRVDVTAEQRYTITQPTRRLLAGLQQPVQVYVLLKGSQMPAGFIKLANTTQGFLANCRSYSNGRLSYSFIEPTEFLQDSIRFPLPDSAKADWLKQNAIKQNELTQTGSRAVFNYPVALITNGEQYTTVNLLQGQGSTGFLNPQAGTLQLETINRAEAQLEYLFAQAIQQLTTTYTPIIAYTTGHGQPTGPETFSLSQTIQDKFRFYLLNLPTQPFISDSIKVLLIVKPTQPFNDADKLKIDQYLMRGGRVIFLVDALYAGMDSLMASGKDFIAYPRNLNLDDLLFKYGVRINPNLVEDRQCDVLPQAVGMVGNQPQIEVLPWPYFPLLYSTSNHPISKSLDAVVMQFPNSVDTVKAPGIEKHILLATSNTSRLTGAPVQVTVEVLKNWENASLWRAAQVPVAVLTQGAFSSLFANRLPGAVADSLAAQGRPYLAKASQPGQVVVTGDADWVLNGMSRQGPLPMGTNPYTQYQFANQTFLQNILDFLTDEQGIMASRSKEFVLRALNPKLLEKQKTAWQWLNIGLPLALLLIFGIIFQVVRQRRYA